LSFSLFCLTFFLKDKQAFKKRPGFAGKNKLCLFLPAKPGLFFKAFPFF
jgi:hypothetical protein